MTDLFVVNGFEWIFYFKYSAFSHLASCAFGLRLCLGVLASFFSFFYACVSRDIMHGSMSPCIIHGTHKNFIKKNRYIYILKIGLTALFIHLKIILL